MQPHLTDESASAKDDEDRGSATVQLTLVVPVLLLMLLLIVQFALVWHAQHIAQAAASRALATARTQSGSAAMGQAQGEQTIAALGRRLLSEPSVRVQRTPTTVTVRVRGEAMAVVPGLRLAVAGQAAGPVERVTTPKGTP
ncbi:TadE/TadG family type IV pilus assembly protein [Streptomyces sp. NPDC050738]|uniref:TadE/TadG family type IV pilus assembly protein n=1 Tax=Streptomyces sp. NPDC050738 TaxID=3154744 RepID=UPI0034415A2D